MGAGIGVMVGSELGLQWEQGLGHCGVMFGVMGCGQGAEVSFGHLTLG